MNPNLYWFGIGGCSIYIQTAFLKHLEKDYLGMNRYPWQVPEGLKFVRGSVGMPASCHSNVGWMLF